MDSEITIGGIYSIDILARVYDGISEEINCNFVVAEHKV